MRPTLAELEGLARRAGDILRAGYEREHQVDYKGEIDLVTEVDHASEAFLLGEIQRLHPGHQIVSEEAGWLAGREDDRWLVDPLDGTVNYAHGVPFFCASIAFVQRGAARLAAVYDPLRDELFLAERGRGAWRNSQRLQVSRVTELKRSLLVTGFPYDAWTTANNNLDHFNYFSRRTQGVRRLGSAALDLCYVAAGRLEGFWELSLNPWDVAAGGLIAQEAGAAVTALSGQADYLRPPVSILAAPPALHPLILAGLQESGGADPSGKTRSEPG
jgi:myo-inositol-1(or 4)-monophosphatase